MKYSPTVSGLEENSNDIQTLEIKYKVEASITVDNSTFFGGIDLMYHLYFPYIQISHKLNKLHTLNFMYESRFGTLGFGYEYKNFKIDILSDKFYKASSLGFDASFIYQF